MHNAAQLCTMLMSRAGMKDVSLSIRNMMARSVRMDSRLRSYKTLGEDTTTRGLSEGATPPKNHPSRCTKDIFSIPCKFCIQDQLYDSTRFEELPRIEF